MRPCEEAPDGDELEWERAERRVVLAANSQFVRAFFQALVSERQGSLAIHMLAMDASLLGAHARHLDSAALAVVQTDPDLLVAQAICVGLSVGWPALSIVALVSSVRVLTPWYLEAFLRGELAGLIDLETTAEEAGSVLEAVAHGRAAVSVGRDPAQVAALGTQVAVRRPTQVTLGLDLTVREQEVLALLKQGATDKEIATRLQMSRSTVGNHVLSVQTKFGARTRVELGFVAGRLERSDQS